MFSSLIIVALFQSTLINLTLEFQAITADRKKQFATLHRFCWARNISRATTAALLQHLETQKSQLVQLEKDVPILQSSGLLMDLHAELRMPLCLGSDFLSRVCDRFAALLRKVCHVSMREEAYHKLDYVFAADDTCADMYIVGYGTFEYDPSKVWRLSAMSMSSEEDAEEGPKRQTYKLHKGSFACEAVLCVYWTHKGRLQALSDPLLYLLNAESFTQIVSEDARPHVWAYEYAEAVAESLRKAQSMTGVEIDDMASIEDIQCMADGTATCSKPSLFRISTKGDIHGRRFSFS
jgi:hypothetical protein